MSYHLASAPMVHFRFMESTPVVHFARFGLSFPSWVPFPSRVLFVVFCFFVIICPFHGDGSLANHRGFLARHGTPDAEQLR